MNSNAFAKGDALAKLIELIGADNKAFKAQDAELLAAINEVRDMFNTDELTVCSWAELVELAQAGNLEPGHKYKINHNVAGGGKNLVNLTVSAKSNSELETIAVADGYLVHIQNGANFGAFKYEIDIVNDGTNVTVAGKRAMPYMDTTGEILLEKFQTGTYWGKYPAEEMALTGYFDIIFPDKTAKFIWFPNSGSTGYAFGLTDVTISIHDIIAFDDLVNALTTINNLGELDVNELTECTRAELNALIKAGELKPGHKYNVTDVYDSGGPINGAGLGPTPVMVVASSNRTLEPIGLLDDGFVTIKPLLPISIDDFTYETDIVNGEFGERNMYNLAWLFGDDYKNYSGKIKSTTDVNAHNWDGYVLSPDGLTACACTVVGLEYSMYLGALYVMEFEIGNVFGSPYSWDILEMFKRANRLNEIADDYFYSHPNSTNSVANLPVDHSMVNVNIYDNRSETLSWMDGLPAGREVIAIIRNTGTEKITITLPVERCNASSVDIEPGKYVEASVVSTVQATYTGNVYGYYTRVSIEGAASGAVEDTFKGTNEVASISNIPIDKPVVDAYISGDGTLSFAEGLEDGREVLVVVHNESDTDALIILPDNCNEDTIIIPANGYNEVSVANINGTYYTRVPSATSGPDTFVGTNEVTNLTNLPVDKSTIKAEISTAQALSWAEGLPAGREVLAIIHNTGSDNISINLPVNCNADSIKIKAGEYIEASLVNIDGYYTRVSIEEVATGGSGEAIEYEEITAADIQAMFNGTYGD